MSLKDVTMLLSICALFSVNMVTLTVISLQLLSLISQLLIAPWPEQYWHRVVTAPAARGALTGVASPCPEFYVREREY